MQIDENTYLKHYGILGMKWGVRRNRGTGVYKNRASRMVGEARATNRMKKEQAAALQKQKGSTDYPNRLERLKATKALEADNNFAMKYVAPNSRSALKFRRSVQNKALNRAAGPLVKMVKRMKDEGIDYLDVNNPKNHKAITKAKKEIYDLLNAAVQAEARQRNLVNPSKTMRVHAELLWDPNPKTPINSDPFIYMVDI